MRNRANNIQWIFVMNQMTLTAHSPLLGVPVIRESINNCRATGTAVFDQLALIAQAFLAGDLVAATLVCFSINARAVSINLRPSKPRLFMSSIHSISSARDLRRNS